MDPELKASRAVMIVHTVLAIAMGWASPQLGILLAGFTGIALLLVCGYACEKLVGKKGIKWWIGNGVIIYLFVWLVSWVYFFNIAGA